MLMSHPFIEHLVGLPRTPEAEGHRPVWCACCSRIPEAYTHFLTFPFMCTQYTAISPMRQRATHNMLRNWIFNGYRRLSGQVGYFIVPFAIGQCPPPVCV